MSCVEATGGWTLLLYGVLAYLAGVVVGAMLARRERR